MSGFLERGQLLYQREYFSEAADQFRQALAANPNDAWAKAWLALALCGMEDFVGAAHMAQEAVYSAPEDDLCHYALGRVLLSRNHLKEALAATREAIRLAPWDVVNHAQESEIHLNFRDWPSTLAAAERGLECDPESVACNNLRSVALTRMGRKEDASAAMESVLARNPENALSHATQGWNYLHAGKVTPALEHFREAMRLDPTNEWARAGIVEAMKARNPLYAIMLKYFLWMGRLSGKNQGLIIFGGYFGNRMLGALSATSPELAPWLFPLRLAYIVFVLSTWLASPLFNLLLRFDKYGKHALSRNQVTASNWLAATLALSLIGLAGCFFEGLNSLWFLGFVVYGVLSIPVSSIFRVTEGWPRMVMAVMTILLFLMGTANLVLIWHGHHTMNKALYEFGLKSLSSYAVGLFITSILANILVFKRRRR